MSGLSANRGEGIPQALIKAIFVKAGATGVTQLVCSPPVPTAALSFPPCPEAAGNHG